MPQSLLDTLQNQDQLKALDPKGMLGIIEHFPQQCREAMAILWQNLSDTKLEPAVRNVVITGLGGSAIGGDYARFVMEEFGSVPLYVNRDYTLPSWVGADTLVIAASYSGNTEETLSAFRAKLEERERVALSSRAEASFWRSRNLKNCLLPKFRADSLLEQRRGICFSLP